MLEKKTIKFFIVVVSCTRILRSARSISAETQNDTLKLRCVCQRRMEKMVYKTRMPLKRVAGKIVRIIYDGGKMFSHPVKSVPRFYPRDNRQDSTTEERKGKQETDTFLRAIRWKRFYSEPDDRLLLSLESRMRIEKRSRKRARDVKPRGERRWEPEASRREEFPWMPRPSAESEKSITSATLVGKAQSHWLSSRGPRYGTREQPQLGQSVRPERKREKPCKSSFRGVSRGASSCRLTRTARNERRRWTSERTKEASGQRSAEASTGALLLWASYNIPVSSAVEQRAPPFASWMTIRRRGTVGSVAGLRDAGWVIASLTDRYYACHRTHAARDLTAS